MEYVISALGAAAAVVVPLLAWVLKLQGRIVALETWREISQSQFAALEERIMAALERIEDRLDRKFDGKRGHADG